MDKFVEYEKLSKKAKKDYNKAKRTISSFNTGTRVMKDAKHPNRTQRKKDFQKAIDNS